MEFDIKQHFEKTIFFANQNGHAETGFCDYKSRKKLLLQGNKKSSKYGELV